MKKLIIISVLFSCSIALASEPKTLRERIFGPRETAPTTPAAPAEQKPGFFEQTKERFFGRRETTPPTTPGAPAEQKPGFLERAKTRFETYQKERQQKQFGSQLGGIAKRAGLEKGGEDRIQAKQQSAQQRQVYEKQQQELRRKRLERERQMDLESDDSRWTNLLYKWLKQLSLDRVKTPAEKEQEVLRGFNTIKSNLKVTSLRASTDIGPRSETVREMLNRIFSDRAIIERLLSTLKPIKGK